jgi:hypothetical protein
MAWWIPSAENNKADIEPALLLNALFALQRYRYQQSGAE